MDSDTCLLTERRPGKRNRVPRRAATGHWIGPEQNSACESVCEFSAHRCASDGFRRRDRETEPRQSEERKERACIGRSKRSIDRSHYCACPSITDFDGHEWRSTIQGRNRAAPQSNTGIATRRRESSSTKRPGPLLQAHLVWSGWCIGPSRCVCLCDRSFGLSIATME